ncbi:hydantoinase B/oxoprolinase family protein [Crateriforma conspicua]|uniref:hydantoinase B/oxoprolinase family protein n=1 Tax=Crateriforma conspicua TaxID=2527996 RepID=UPI00118B0DAF|nr:hydantoinase B/oxoprolinase family protein [Crateriforma conspicua]QDV60887.1 Acetophenone carboxylase gamma subunit [Crateriforma conspicua]
MVRKNALTSDTIRLWIDVGGTFTDAFVSHQGRRHSTKVLSSGLVRYNARRVDTEHWSVDLPDEHRVPGFWNSATVRRIDSGGQAIELGTVSETDATSGGLKILTDERGGAERDSGQADLSESVVLELDAGLEAPALAAHVLLKTPIAASLPELSVRLGTTRGTNALLTRTGAPTALITTAGFEDLLLIGEQDRPDLFAKDIIKPAPLPKWMIGINERLDHHGEVIRRPDRDEVIAVLRDLKRQGAISVAICLMHAHVNDDHERRVAKWADEVGFENISRSSEVAPLIKLVHRAETTCLDAYLNPILDDYLRRVRQQLGGSRRCRLLVMTSAGNLVPDVDYRGRDSVLSGPAGGVVALGRLADAMDCQGAIGLDMGGTSTDVSRFVGKVGRRYESEVSGTRILTPMMDIHTVAAGGGSVCASVAGRLTVGPASAGADPGPACYGRRGPLTVTDVNLLLGRLPADRFPFPLDRRAAMSRLKEIAAERNSVSASSSDCDDLAAGFLQIACTHMAEAVRTVTTSQGIDPRDMALVGFGGAAGGHLCDVAELLGITEVIDHPDASLLSALGMGLASTGHVATAGVYQAADQCDVDQLIKTAESLQTQCHQRLANELAEKQIDSPSDLGATINDRLQTRFEIDCRYLGTESTLTLDVNLRGQVDPNQWVQRFHQRHEQVFGYRRDHPVQWVAVRCEVTLASDSDIFVDPSPERSINTASDHDGDSENTTGVWINGRWQVVRVWERQALTTGQSIDAPAMIISDHSTLLLMPGWNAKVEQGGTIRMKRSTDRSPIPTDTGDTEAESETVDDVTVEVVARRLQGIADSMGEVLRRTAISVNVRERKDYSCAVFRNDGALIANAPHVPVHLGAMGHTVRHLMHVYPVMHDGDCYISNHPFAGGSHLPDVTVVTPVFCRPNDRSGAPDFIVASRAHHAEIGGITPGSMPPDATCLAQEGVLIRDFPLCRNGHENTDALMRLLTGGDYPSRCPDQNLADIQAQRAAGTDGVRALRELTRRYDVAAITRVMDRLIDLAGNSLDTWLTTLPDEPRHYQDQLDDGTVIAVQISKSHQDDRPKLKIDFTGTSDVHPHGFNATPAIVTAAVLYVLKVAGGDHLPLCDGLLRDVQLVIPVGLLNPPVDDDPRRCAAVVAGNVETSQRVVDVLMGCLDLAAASQGTMNNLLIGDDTFGYYETIGGGAGATSQRPGCDGVHTHMTNTRITDPEIFESRLPCSLIRFAIRRNSGGSGRHRGGDGLVREIEFHKDLTVSWITGRRTTSPYGVRGGCNGATGINQWVHDGEIVTLRSADTIEVSAGDRFRILSPGGGGWGVPPTADDSES